MPAIFAWPALSTSVAYTTIIGVILALLALTRSRIQNWATRRAVYQLKFWAWQQTPVSAPASAVTRRTKMGLWFQQRSRNATLRLVPIVYRASLYKLQTTVADELEKNTHAGIYVPRPDSDPLYVEIAAYIKPESTDGFVGSTVWGRVAAGLVRVCGPACFGACRSGVRGWCGWWRVGCGCAAPGAERRLR